MCIRRAVGCNGNDTAYSYVQHAWTAGAGLFVVRYLGSVQLTSITDYIRAHDRFALGLPKLCSLAILC